jgi:hypothetical protein
MTLIVFDSLSNCSWNQPLMQHHLPQPPPTPTRSYQPDHNPFILPGPRLPEDPAYLQYDDWAEIAGQGPDDEAQLGDGGQYDDAWETQLSLDLDQLLSNELQTSL